MAGVGLVSETLELRATSPATIRLLFVEEGSTLYVLPSHGGAGWFAEAVRSGEVRIRQAPGHEVRCAARVIFAAADVERIGGLFRAKYGEVRTRAYFGSVRRA
ncbi:MAG: hypothetical protein L3K07_09165, partial [Thermoplasmata archaeon]|nr:hypothetical protein [Thermoplasmata archaeon]